MFDISVPKSLIPAPEESGAVLTPLRMPVRVEPLRGEPLLSLLTRSALANGFYRIDSVLEGARLTEGRPDFITFKGGDVAERLSQALGLPRAYISDRMHPRVEIEGDDLVDWFGTPLPRHFIEAKIRRVSPRSLRTSPHHRAEWMIRPLSFCPESMEFLVSDCRNCGKQLRWATSTGLWCCDRCGKSLTRTQPGKVAWEMREDLAAVAALVSPSADARTRVLTRLPAPFSSWHAGDVFASLFEIMILQICALDDVPVQTVRSWRLGDFNYVTPARLRAAYRALFNWDVAFVDIVKAISSRGLSKSNGKGGKLILLGPLEKFARETDRALDTPFRHLVRSALPRIIRDAGIPIKRKADSKMFSGERSRYVSAKEIENVLRLPRESSRILKENSKALVSRTTGRFCIRLYDRELLSKSVQAWRDSLDATKVGIRLGVPPYVVPLLARDNLISAVSDHDARLLAKGEERYTADSINQLVASIESLTKDSACGLTDISIYHAMGGRRLEPGPWLEIIRAILAGKLAARLVDRNASLSKQLMVARKAIVEIIAGVPHAPLPDVEISCVAASNTLHWSQLNIASAFRAGMLPGRKLGRLMLISLHGLAQFNKKYVGTKELADRTQRQGLSIYKQLIASGCLPVAELANTCIWNRDTALGTLFGGSNGPA